MEDTGEDESSGADQSQKQQPAGIASPPDQYRERLLTMGVLQFLSMGNLRDANVMRDAWTTAAAAAAGDGGPGVGGGPDGMQKFCRMLCKTCEYDAGTLFQRLVSTVTK